MKRKIVLLTFVSILLLSLIPNDTSAQTGVNPFEVYDMMTWETGASFLVDEYEIMTETSSLDPSEIYHVSENLWNGDFTTNGFMDMLVYGTGTEYIGGQYLNYIDVVGKGEQFLNDSFSVINMEHNEWDSYFGWSNWTDSMLPKFEPEMDRFSERLYMNETYIPIGIPDQPDYHNDGGFGPFGFLDGIMLDFEMTNLFTFDSNDTVGIVNDVYRTFEVTTVIADYTASLEDIFGFQWGPYWFDVYIDMYVEFTYILVYDRATGMLLSQNQYVHRILDANFSGIVYNGYEDVQIDYTFHQITDESFFLALDKITVPTLYDGVRMESITDGPEVVGDYFGTSGSNSEGQYSDMVVQVHDTTTGQLLHEDQRGDYRYRDAEIETDFAIFYISDWDIGVLQDNTINDLGGTYGWSEYSYDINQGGLITDYYEDHTDPGMGYFTEMGFDIVPYDNSYLPLFDYPDVMYLDNWDFKDGGEMWVDPFGVGDEQIPLTKSSSSYTMLKTYEINGFVYELLVEKQTTTYGQTFSSNQTIPIGDPGQEVWVDVSVDAEVLIQFELYYDTETTMIVGMSESTFISFRVFADTTIYVPTIQTLDLQTASMDVYIDMNFETYKDYEWNIAYSSFMYLEEQTEIPTDPIDPTDPTNESESSLSPIPVLELAFIAPAGLVMAMIVRRRK